MFDDSELKNEWIVETISLNEGSVIFNRKIGFNIIQKIEKNIISPVICFKRVGYTFDEEIKHFVWDKITFGKKCIMYDQTN